MTNDNDNDTPLGAIEDMLADLGHADDTRLLTALTEMRGLATEVPVASPEVVALLQGATRLRSSARHRVVLAAAAGALAFGGASAAAATNNLPAPIQEVVARVTGAPHPVKDELPEPTNPTHVPDDEPDQHKDKKDKAEKSGHGNDHAPGQVQKATKPDTSDPGPAKPADPGSHGRARADEVRAGHDKGDNKKHKDEKFGDKPSKHGASKSGQGQKHDGNDDRGKGNKGKGGGNGHNQH